MGVGKAPRLTRQKGQGGLSRGGNARIETGLLHCSGQGSDMCSHSNDDSVQ